MPRFLNTWTGEFEWHNDPASVHYAILSHTWNSLEDGGEQTYEEVRKLQAEVFPSEPDDLASQSLPIPTSETEDLNPAPLPSPFFSHPKLSKKIVMACKVARDDGYSLLWIDTCCINSSSSAELAEAINSMYEWYRLSDVCYAFLADVPDCEDPRAELSMFQGSRWHKRGWTLQELIAPGRVLFLTETWSLLGTKTGLATTIENITGIHFDILVGRARPDQVSIARRMSWAARRQTSRVEDRAYSLLGIFGVHMSPIYGEGENAFLRLQEEILRTVADQTIFAWGDYDTSSHGLLAPNPRSFWPFKSARPAPPSIFAARLGLPIEDAPPLHAVVTPGGVRLKLLCIDLDRFPDIAQSILPFASRPERRPLTCANSGCVQKPHVHLLALLRCHNNAGELIGLPLRHPPPGPGEEKGLCVGFCTSCHGIQDSRSYPSRIVVQDGVLAQILARRSLTTVEVCILHHLSSPFTPKEHEGYGAIKFEPGVAEHAAHFEYNPESIQHLDILGFRLSPLQVRESRELRKTVVSFTLSSKSAFRPWTTDLPQQNIAISISFTSEGQLSHVKAVFSVENFAFGPPPNSPTTPSLGAESDIPGPNSPFKPPPSFILDTSSGAFLAQGTSTSYYIRNRGLHPGLFARAEFAVYAGFSDPALDSEDQVVWIRWLKIDLHRVMRYSDNHLCIAVELSDMHRFEKPDDLSTIWQSSSHAQSPVDGVGLLQSPAIPQLTFQTLSETVNTLESRVDALSAQNATLITQNAALASQMAAMLEQLQPLAGDLSDKAFQVSRSQDSSHPTAMRVDLHQVPEDKRMRSAQSFEDGRLLLPSTEPEQPTTTYTGSDTVETLRLKRNQLRSQIYTFLAQNMALSHQVATMVDQARPTETLACGTPLECASSHPKGRHLSEDASRLTAHTKAPEEPHIKSVPREPKPGQTGMYRDIPPESAAARAPAHAWPTSQGQCSPSDPPFQVTKETSPRQNLRRFSSIALSHIRLLRRKLS